MFVPFNDLPGSSRIWIYQSNRKFNSEETIIISEVLSTFTQEWNAHGVPLRSSFDIRFGQFIILGADEQHNAASGCSIDTSTRTVKELSQRLGVDLFDRAQVAFKNGEDVMTLSIGQLKNKYQEGVWGEATPVFNNLIGTKDGLEKEWILPAGLTWLKRYFGRETVAG